MTNLVIMKDQQAVTSSLQVAETFEKNHQHVLRDLDNLKEGVQNWTGLFYEDEYVHPQNKQTYRQIIMNRDGFTLLAMGFTGSKALQFKLKYIEAFNEMERHIKENQKQIPSSPREALKLMFDYQEETTQRVESLENEVTYLKEDSVLPVGDYNLISERINKRVSEVTKAYGITNKKARGELFKDINGGIKKITGVGRRTQLRMKHNEMVLDFVNDWEPATATKTIVRQIELLEGE